MATETRVLIALCTASVLLGARPTRADTFKPPALVERADIALARTLPIVFRAGTLESRSLPSAASGRHSITLGELQVQVSPKLSVRGGLGFAQIVDAPQPIAGATTGCAFGGAASYSIIEPAFLRVGVELSALHVRYGSAGFTDETMLFALSMK